MCTTGQAAGICKTDTGSDSASLGAGRAEVQPEANGLPDEEPSFAHYHQQLAAGDRADGEAPDPAALPRKGHRHSCAPLRAGAQGRLQICGAQASLQRC